MAKKPSKRTVKLSKPIEELIASDKREDWDVARDHALQEGIQDLIVQLDMARALDVSPSDLVVTEERPYDESFEVSLGRKEWVVVPDEDTAREIALARVTEDLENEPELFNPNFIQSHIDQEALKKWVYDARMEDDYVDEIAERQVDDFWRLAEQFGLDVPEPDEEGEMPEPSSKMIDKVKEAYAEDASQNPMSFFEDIYGRAEAPKHAIEAVGIDIAAAAEEAINVDGWEHFLAHYDGKSYETDSGLVYWRTN